MISVFCSPSLVLGILHIQAANLPVTPVHISSSAPLSHWRMSPSRAAAVSWCLVYGEKELNGDSALCTRPRCPARSTASMRFKGNC